MKRYITTFLMLSIFLIASAQTTGGIKFLDAEFGEVLALAELEGKLVFVDAYTNWCAPCKKMDKEVFSQKEVGDFFNNNFVNVKINMEKGEGIDLAKKYFIYAYPSLLFINYDGTIAHRSAGYKDEKNFLVLGERALDDRNNLAGLTKQYENGDRNADFLMKYLQASFQAADGKHLKILENYMETQSDWSSPESQELIFNLLDNPNSKLFDYLVENKTTFQKTYGETDVNNKIQTLVYESLAKGTTQLENADVLFKRAYPKDGKRLAAHYKSAYYQQTENGDAFAKAAIEYVKSFPEISTEALNDLSWGFYDLVENKKDLKKALRWTKKAAKKENTFLNNEVLAALYSKIGKKKKALKIAEKAISIAKASGENYDSIQEVIQEIKEGE